jgi:hypothetical protein
MTDPMKEQGKLSDQELDELIRRELLSVSAPADLRQKLLQPEQLGPRVHGTFRKTFAALVHSANDGIFRRVLPVAACLMVALGIAFWSGDNQRELLANEIFTHMYLEGQLDNADSAEISLATVNTRMEDWMGAHLAMSDTEDLKVTFAKDCWVAKRMAFHLIMKGETGAVTVMMIPAKDGIGGIGKEQAEFDISDPQYSGLVTPTEGGYLVVVGSKQESIAGYRNLLSSKLDWEY